MLKVDVLRRYGNHLCRAADDTRYWAYDGKVYRQRPGMLKAARGGDIFVWCHKVRLGHVPGVNWERIGEEESSTPSANGV